MKIFVINLEKDKERRHSIIEQFDSLNLEYEFSTGLLGASLTPEQKKAWYNEKKAYRNHCRSLVPAHIGCSLSHVNVYRKIIAEKLPYALILEDDVILPSNFKQLLDGIEEKIIKNNAEVILLSPAIGINKNGRVVNKEISIIPYKNGFFTSSYIVTQKAAQALLKDLFPINDVADCWKRLVKHKVIDLYVLSSGFIEQDQDTFGSSTNIDVLKYTKKDIYNKIKFKLCRAFWLSIDIFVSAYNRHYHPYKDVLK